MREGIVPREAIRAHIPPSLQQTASKEPVTPGMYAQCKTYHEDYIQCLICQENSSRERFGPAFFLAELWVSVLDLHPTNKGMFRTRGKVQALFLKIKDLSK